MLLDARPLGLINLPLLIYRMEARTAPWAQQYVNDLKPLPERVLCGLDSIIGYEVWCEQIDIREAYAQLRASIEASGSQSGSPTIPG